MRFMIIVKATRDSEAGMMPEESLIAGMVTYGPQHSDVVDCFRDLEMDSKA